MCARFCIGCSELPYFPCWHFYDIYIAGRSFEKAPKGSQLSHRSFEELTPRQNEAVSSRLAGRRHRRKPGNYCGVPALPLFLLSRMWVIFHTYFDLTSFFARVNFILSTEFLWLLNWNRHKSGNDCGVPASPLFLLSRMWIIFHTWIQVFFSGLFARAMF